MTLNSEIRFKEGDTLADLSQRVRGAYDKGESRILIACEDSFFPDHVVMGGMWDSPVGPVQWLYVISEAFKQVGGLPEGSFRAVDNPYYLQGGNYAMCLEYSPKK